MNNFINILKQSARAGGDVLIDFFQKRNLSAESKGPGDFVTEADFASEKQIINVIKQYFPDHNLVAEECGSVNNNSDYTWIIDPLDGTRNFYHGLKHFCVSIGLTYKNELYAGVIYDPINDNLFLSVKGQGALLNDKKIRVNNRAKNIEDAFIISTDFIWRPKECTQESYQVRNVIKNKLIPIIEKENNLGVLRIFSGSSALSMSQLACGDIDLLFISPFFTWDVIAGSCLIKEAGGVVYCHKDKNLLSDVSNIKKYVLIAGNVDLVNKVKNMLQDEK